MYLLGLRATALSSVNICPVSSALITTSFSRLLCCLVELNNFFFALPRPLGVTTAFSVSSLNVLLDLVSTTDFLLLEDFSLHTLFSLLFTSGLYFLWVSGSELKLSGLLLALRLFLREGLLTVQWVGFDTDLRDDERVGTFSWTWGATSL